MVVPAVVVDVIDHHTLGNIAEVKYPDQTVKMIVTPADFHLLVSTTPTSCWLTDWGSGTALNFISKDTKVTIVLKQFT